MAPTLLNITQQIASSCGVAIMSVLLTNHLQASKLAGPIPLDETTGIARQIGGPRWRRRTMRESCIAI